MLTCSKRERTALAVFCALTAGALLITGLFLLLRPGLFQIPAAADVESMFCTSLRIVASPETSRPSPGASDVCEKEGFGGAEVLILHYTEER